MDGRVTPPFPGIRLVALDIDGTLLRSDRTVSSRTRAAVARARAIGVRVVLVTGRRDPSARRVAGQGWQTTALGCRPLARDVAGRASVAGRARGMEPILHCGSRGEGFLLVDARARPAGLVGYYLDRAREELRMVEDVLEALAREEPIQVMFGGSLAEVEDLVGALATALRGAARLERTVYPASDFALVDVLDPGVGKADALAFLQQRWGITAAETLAIGDNWNDRSMLEAAGCGLLMGNAPSELLKLGLPVLPTNDEDGVAHAIETHVLG